MESRADRGTLAAAALRALVLCAWMQVGALTATAAEVQDHGPYRVLRLGGGLLGFGCQPRTELHVREPGDAPGVYRHLGTCGTPRFVTDQMKLPSDPSCFAIAEDGQSLVYMHQPAWCGAGEAARAKPGGVYRHRAGAGERLLYTDRQVGTVWSRAPLPGRAIRVSWSHALPSPSGAKCSQRLLIFADGREWPEGEPATVHGCREGAAEAAAAAASAPARAASAASGP